MLPFYENFVILQRERKNTDVAAGVDHRKHDTRQGREPQ